MRALGSPVDTGAGVRASVGCACARDGPGACPPARAHTFTLADCTRDCTYIAPRYGGCGRVGTALVTLKGRATYGMQGALALTLMYPYAPASAIACIILVACVGAGGHLGERGSTARTIEARTIRSAA